MANRNPVIIVDEEESTGFPETVEDLNFKTDEELAQLLQSQENKNLYTNAEDLLNNDSDSDLITGVDDDLSYQDDPEPFPDIRDLFIAFNAKYFQQILNSVEVKWSPRMTLCAGLCCYERGGYCVIKMSEPLLKYRTKKDMIDTLLHEMIHAFLFVTKNNKDRDGHGPEFIKLMNEINKNGHNVTVFHSFHGEVDMYRTHWWQCDKCKNIIKRAMNRAPSPNDPWWNQHQNKCGGKYVKIKEPEDYGKNKGKRKRKRKDDDKDEDENNKITKFFKKDNGDKVKIEISSKQTNNDNSAIQNSNRNNNLNASKELKISREDVGEDKSGPRLPTNFPKIEFESDNEEQPLVRKPKRKGIHSLNSSNNDIMSISNDSIKITADPAKNEIFDFDPSTAAINRDDSRMNIEASEEEKQVQRDILAAAALKRFNKNINGNYSTKPTVNVKIESNNKNNVNMNSPNNNVQLNKTSAITKEKVLTEACPVCMKKISGTEMEMTMHVEKCLSGDSTSRDILPIKDNDNDNAQKIKKENGNSRQIKHESYQLSDNLIDFIPSDDDSDLVVLD